MENNGYSEESILDRIKTILKERTKKSIEIAVNAIFDNVDLKAENIPEVIAKICSKPEVEQEIENVWSELLFEEGLIPKGYNGLPNVLLVSNLHQEGYLDGLYAGYVLAMMALADNGASKEMIASVRNDMRPNLVRLHYNDREEFFNRYKDEKYNWIEKL